MNEARRYFDAMVASAIDSSVNGALVFLGASGVDYGETGSGLPWHTLFSILIVSLVVGMLKYVAAHPLLAEVERMQAVPVVNKSFTTETINPPKIDSKLILSGNPAGETKTET